MKIKPDCIPCILKMSLKAIRNMELDEDSVKQLYMEILKMPYLVGKDWSVTSADVTELVMKKMILFVGNDDPFQAHKIELNKRVMELYPFLKKKTSTQPDKLKAAVKLAVMGNSNDVMIAEESFNNEKVIERNLRLDISEHHYEEFKKRLNKSRLLLYFGDNAGEMVFDKLLIETIKEQKDIEIVYVVRNAPALNDATLRDAEFVGMEKAATVIENGIEGNLPGTILNRCSRQVQDLVNKADMIVSKGGGNFDTLDEESEEIKEKTTFMLLSKCHPYCKYFGAAMYQPIIFNF